MSEQEQWREIEGGVSAARWSLGALQAQLDRIKEIPDVLADRAPSVALEEVIAAATRIEAWGSWIQRIAADEAMGRDDVDLRQTTIAETTGYGIATVRRWAASPLMTENGAFGPRTMSRWGRVLKE